MAAPVNMAPFIDAVIVHEKRSSTADRIAADQAIAGAGIRVVHPSEYKEAARTLAIAFRDDHVMRYAIDTPDRAHWPESSRFQLFTQLMEYVTYMHCLNGLVIATGPNYDCVSLWVPPGKVIDGWLTIARSGLWRLYYQLSAQGRHRFFSELLPLLGNSLAEVVGERSSKCWYLGYIGTKPESRGRGHARKLIEYITAQADREGQICYLESSHAVNLQIYGKMGFKFNKKIYLMQDDEPICMDLMTREPVKYLEEKN